MFASYLGIVEFPYAYLHIVMSKMPVLLLLSSDTRSLLLARSCPRAPVGLTLIDGRRYGEDYPMATLNCGSPPIHLPRLALAGFLELQSSQWAFARPFSGL